MTVRTLIVSLLFGGLLNLEFCPAIAEQPADEPPVLILPAPFSELASPPVSEFASPPEVSADPAFVGQELPLALSAQATDFIREMVLLLAPRHYEDEDDWGLEQRIQSGLDVDFDGLRLDTKRRWKSVNHGLWRKAEVNLVDPEQHLQLQVWVLPAAESGHRRYRLRLVTRIEVTGRQQQWNYGARLYSLSATALADISLDAEFELQQEVVDADGGSSLRLLPQILHAHLRLEGFRLQNVSHLQGSAVRELGRMAKSLLDRRIRKEGPKLATKINRRIAARPDRFEIPVGLLSLF